MAILLAACVTAFLISFIVTPVVIKYSLAKNMGDVPGGRKIHKKITPSLGGIAIFLGFSIAFVIWLEFDQWAVTRYVLASLFIVFLLGVRDDIVPLRALHKLYGQIVAVIILMGSSIQINSLHGLLGIYELPLVVSFIVTVFTVIVITNSFNLIDGLDGLAGSISFVALTSFGIWFYMVDDHVFSLLCFAMVGGILAFLVFNWEPSEIFMGDTGAMVIGMLLAVLTVHFMNLNASLPINHPVKFTPTIAAAVCFIIIPLSDTLRIIILRILKGQSPFTPDKSHIHHAIMRLGMTHSKTTIILTSVHILFIAMAVMLRNLSEIYALAAVILLVLALTFILDRLILRRLSTKGSNR
jgi:UDP-N-acetylmuramyl pentapeptide phosphotransferase/UDP-N-acetylglucosamine-1-phosphate transferase